ncbi:MAG: tRNA dihydrouridine synthase DusB [Candidatus Omnitrophota bacterium]
MFKIGKLSLCSNIILSPLAGVSDLPFRLLNRTFGASLAFVEMLNVRSLSYKSKKTRSMLITNAQDKPLGVQLLGKEEKYILKAMDILKSYTFDILDFNAACPAKKVVRRGEGASLLREPKELKKLLSLVVKHASVPVTVKIRAGWDSDTARDVALQAEDAGIDALCIHGRTREQGYHGRVDYEAIRRVKKALGIPVIASGDIFSAELAKKMVDETGCDAIAVARGCLGNPWIFQEIERIFAKGELLERPDVATIIAAMSSHLDAYVDFYGERIAIIKFRKFFSWYTKGFRKVRHLRTRASLAKTRGEMRAVIAQLSDNRGQ